ncbi:hypothetical protein DSECCO2_169640 [anaerobic digester metagenome]
MAKSKWTEFTQNAVGTEQLKSAGSEFKSGWKAPSNIAIVKYWGKKDGQIPQNPSLSFSLNGCYTQTQLEVKYSPKGFSLTINPEGKEFAPRIEQFLRNVEPLFPFLANVEAKVTTANSFPHSVGIASSASGFASLALCLCHIEEQIKGNLGFGSPFLRKASYVARLGSGSASRSVFGGWQEWGYLPELPNSTNEYALSLSPIVDPKFFEMRDAILVVSTSPKVLSSTQGHALMANHPFADARYAEARINLNAILKALRKGDLKRFYDIAESEAMTLHGLIMSSKNQPMLLKPQSLQIIERIKAFRTEKGINIGFTIDAGPNIHLLYTSDVAQIVEAFVNEQLKPLCENQKVIFDSCGKGPELV